MIHIIPNPVFDADVLIAGAGPAGSSLAAYLGRLGYKVILIDSEKFPRDKVCGDFVGPVALKELENLGVGDRFKDACRIGRAAVFLDGNLLIEQLFPALPGFPSFGQVIPRMILDEEIFRIAQQSGARTLEQCRLKYFNVYPSHVDAECLLDGHPVWFTVKMIVGADGSNSTVSRIIKSQGHHDSGKILAVRAYYTGTSGPEDRADLHFTRDGFPGYSWFFPVGNGVANVGAGMVRETIPHGSRSLKEMLEDLILSDPNLNYRMARAKPAGKIEAWPLATYDPGFGNASDRVLLIGDAGRLINALNGEGIQYALLSARWAAHTIQKAIDGNEFDKGTLDDLTRQVDEAIGYDLAVSRLIIQFIRNRDLNPLWIEMLKIIIQRASIDEAYADTAGGVLAGVLPASRVIHPVFLAKTVFQAGIDLGNKGVNTLNGGVETWQAFLIDSLRFGTKLSGNAIHNRGSYLKWARNISGDFLRLMRASLQNLPPQSGAG